MMLHPISAIAFSPESGSSIYLLLFFVGLAVGSFLNVVILRYKPEESLFKNIFGRSHCDNCGHKLLWLELIPLLSFVWQFGRCRNCQAKLSLQYPIVEFLSGLVLILIPLSFSSGVINIFGKSFYPSFVFTPKPLVGGELEGFIMTAIWILVFLTLLVISVIDLRLKIIPDSLNLFLLFLGIGSLATRYYFHDFGLMKGDSYGTFLGSYASVFRFSDDLLINFAAGALLSLIFLAALYFITRGYGIGFGDVKLALPLGLLLGYPDIVVAVILAFLIGALFGIALLISKKKNLKAALPFAPFMAAGVTLVFFFGYHIINAYFQFFRL